MAKVETRTATVFVGGGRRWFTRKAAERAIAKAAIKKRCECSRGDRITPDYVCEYHRDGDRFQRMIRLFIAMHLRPTGAPDV